MPINEALNPMTNVDADGEILTGKSTYWLRLPKHTPVDGFWSITVYESDGAGRWFLYDNSIDRYAISSTTPGLEREEHGWLSIYISHNEPIDRTNWLPSPRGRFKLVFRAYRPQEAFMDGSFALPAVEKFIE